MWRWSSRQLSEAAEVLGDRSQGELDLSAVGSSEAEATEAQDALQVGEQHLDLLRNRRDTS